LQNPRLAAAGPQQDLTFLQGKIALANGYPNVASLDFRKALNLVIRPGFALRAAATLGAAGHPDLGMQLITQYRAEKMHTERPILGMAMLHAWVLSRQHYWEHELDRLEKTLRQQAISQAMEPKASAASSGRPTLKAIQP
jgi:hypothetical protein